MAEQEGIIKYQLTYSHSQALAKSQIKEINSWRRVCYLAGLIGQTTERYLGYGFGNISIRLNLENKNSFLISGTQTGNIPELNKNHYSIIKEASPEKNNLTATGPIKPSSEALSHAALYNLKPEINAVIHAHAPTIWQQANSLKIPATKGDAPFGTPEMAKEIQDLFQITNLAETKILTMTGHEDGIISFGKNIEEAGTILLKYFALSLQF